MDIISKRERLSLCPRVALGLALAFLEIAALPGYAAAIPPAAEALPGKGLAQHDFLYAGESKNRHAFIVRKGRVVWTYDDPAGKSVMRSCSPMAIYSSRTNSL